MSRGQLTKRLFLFSLTGLYLFLVASDLFAGTYLDSAHGSSNATPGVGVFRPIIGDTPPSGFGYSRGNCAHCHEQHASIAGSEPAPSSGIPSAYELFAPNFNTAVTSTPYSQSDNFCFYCHNNSTSAQAVLNNDYSHAFGCALQGSTAIMDTMNQRSYHNLADVMTFALNTFSWYTSSSNPCDACHNPHLAKRNWNSPKDTSFSAISKPNNHFELWGTTETMGSSYNTKYQAPFCSNSLADFEPAASVDAVAARTSTPDYVDFCTTCHTQTATIYSTTLNRNLEPINWDSGGDKHGLVPMDGSVSTKPPFDSPDSGTNFVLSCLNCHEPHGSENVMLLRRRANGSTLSDAITSLDNAEFGLLCLKCHVDDEVAYGDSPNSWEYVHHYAPDAPYTRVECVNCHIVTEPVRGGKKQIPCMQCHYHGGLATKPDKNGVYRLGF